MIKLPDEKPVVDDALKKQGDKKRALMEKAKRALPNREKVPDDERDDLLGNVRES